MTFQPFAGGKPSGKFEVFADGFAGAQAPRNADSGHVSRRRRGAGAGRIALHRRKREGSGLARRLHREITPTLRAAVLLAGVVERLQPARSTPAAPRQHLKHRRRRRLGGAVRRRTSQARTRRGQQRIFCDCDPASRGPEARCRSKPTCRSWTRCSRRSRRRSCWSAPGSRQSFETTTTCCTTCGCGRTRRRCGLQRGDPDRREVRVLVSARRVLRRRLRHSPRHVGADRRRRPVRMRRSPMPDGHFAIDGVPPAPTRPSSTPAAQKIEKDHRRAAGPASSISRSNAI